MRFRNTLIAAVIFGVLGGAIYLDYLADTRRERKETAEKKVFPIDPNDRNPVSGIDIIRGDEVVSLERKNGDWLMTKPVETQADADKAGGLVATLSWLRITGRLGKDTAAGDLKPYGLDPPALEVVVHPSGGGADETLYVGSKSPIGSDRYARRKGDDEILTISASISRIEEAKVDDLRYGKILGMDAWEVSRFEADRDGRKTAFSRDGTGWKIVSPYEFPADADKVTAKLSALIALKAKGFAPQGASLDSVGLGEPDAILSVQGKKGPPIEVRVAGLDGNGNMWAKRSDMPEIFLLPGTTRDALRLDADGCRDSRVVPADRSAITEIRTRTPAGEKILVKGAGATWRWGSEKGPAVDEGKVRDLLDALDATRADSYRSAKASEAQAAGSTLHLGVSGGGAEPFEVDVGRKVDGHYEVRSSASGFVYEVESGLVGRLIAAAAAIEAPVPAAASGAGSSSQGDSSS